MGGLQGLLPLITHHTWFLCSINHQEAFQGCETATNLSTPCKWWARCMFPTQLAALQLLTQTAHLIASPHLSPVQLQIPLICWRPHMHGPPLVQSQCGSCSAAGHDSLCSWRRAEMGPMCPGLHTQHSGMEAACPGVTCVGTTSSSRHVQQAYMPAEEAGGPKDASREWCSLCAHAKCTHRCCV